MEARKAMSFKLEETTIARIHTALRAGEVTCVDLVEGYLAGLRPMIGAVQHSILS